MTERDVILRELEPLFAQAEEQHKWFYSNYQQLWFTPNELRRAHRAGKFIWGPANWTLRHIGGRLAELHAEIAALQKEEEDISQRIVHYSDPL